MTSATCGLRGFLSSPSAALQSSLESRLRRQLDGAGSTLFSLIWKRKATPAGRPYYQLAASARRTSGSDCGSWPTPNAGPQNDGDTTWRQRQIELKAKHGNDNGFGMTLGQAVSLASWNSPAASDGDGGKRPAAGTTMTGRHPNGNKINMGLASQVHIGVATGSPAQMEKRGQLNPAHSRWLMGYPRAWDECAPIKSQKSRKT
jgi:hypothetical protein